MKSSLLILLILSAVLLAAAEKETKDIDVDDEDYEDELERGHRKRRRRKQQQQLAASGPCGALGYGRTLGWGGGTSSTYVSAPVQNYYIGCGGAQPQQQPFLPVAPLAPLAPFQPYPGGFGGHHQHNHHHNHGGHHGGQHGGFNGYPQPQFNYQNQGFNQQPLYDQYQPYSQGYQRPQRPVQGVVSAAASGLGTALADYISGGNRPKKTYKQVTKTVNQLFKPLYNWF